MRRVDAEIASVGEGHECVEYVSASHLIVPQRFSYLCGGSCWWAIREAEEAMAREAANA